MAEIIYKNLSYRIIGIAFQVNNLLGPGLEEKVYQKAFEELLKEEKLKYQRELYFPISINGEIITRKYFDFLIDDKIVVEIKIGTRDYREVCSQIFHYIKMSKIKLGLVIRFTKDGVKIKRIPNLRD